MDLKQLRSFLGIAETGSISAASLRLRVAQPALSQQLARLEAGLGVTLMLRSSRGVTLTAAGEVLKREAERLLREAERAREAVRAEAAGPVRGRVAIGLPTTVAMLLTLPLLQALRAEHPDLALHLAESQSGHLLEWLRQGRIDLAVLFDQQGAQPGLTLRPLVEEELYLAGTTGSGEEIALQDALRLPVLLPGREHGFRRLLDAHAARAGGAWQVVAEVDALPHLKAGVAAGLADTVLPWGALGAEIAAGRLQARRIVAPVLRRTAVLAWAGDRPASRGQQAAEASLLALVRRLVGEGAWRGRLLLD
ncbi:LysR family transcriptional regulator [Roseomonas sp. 18066]|uniref:LysR family transcriptional regulator n=1 Tax=Roseomonas sp. 18066 TaxID=2681412 RepID=UPI001359F45C|nr:LysR family transcriptional regulator [Roseomonas sp. 18066]